ncbi:MAG: hypothetical protein V8T45_01890 [Oscillospiraceae bacterium]
MYYLDGNTIKTNDPQTQYQAKYTVENAGVENNVSVALTKGNYTFSHELMAQTIYFNGRASYTVNGVNGLTGSVNPDGTLVWTVKTNKDWWLNKLEINGVKVSVPLDNSQSVETIMPSGTVVRINRTGDWNSFTYTISFSNCYENLVVTSGNLNGKNHQEYMPTTYTGIAQAQYFKDGAWHDMSIGQPVSRDALETRTESGDFFSGKKSTDTAKFRFKLLPGYGEPELKINDKPVAAELDGDGWYTTESVRVFEMTTRPWGVEWTNNECGFGGYTRFIHIVAQPIDVTVEYKPGEVTGAENLPTDSNTYNLTNNNKVLIPLAIPSDPTDKMVFTGWLNGEKSYKPNQLVPLSELAIEGGKAAFTAQWVSVENAEQINFTINIVEGTKTLDTISSSAPNGVPVILDVNSKTIQDWLAEHPEYQISNDNTLYYDKIENNQVVTLKVEEKTVAINYEAVGPDGADNFGSVAPESESVKVKTGNASGLSSHCRARISLCWLV